MGIHVQVDLRSSNLCSIFFSILPLEFLEPFQRQVCMNGHNTAAMMHVPSPENEDQLFRAESGSGY